MEHLVPVFMEKSLEKFHRRENFIRDNVSEHLT